MSDGIESQNLRRMMVRNMSDDLLRSLQGWEHSLANEESELVCRAIDEIAALRAEVERQRQQLAYLGGTVEVLSLSEQKLNAQLSARDAEVRALRDALQNCVAVLENADASSGDCCCGITMDSHDYTDGHSPVDSGVYAKDVVLGMADDALALLTGEPGPGGEG